MFCFYGAGSLDFLGSGYFRCELCLSLSVNRESNLLFKIQLLIHGVNISVCSNLTVLFLSTCVTFSSWLHYG